MTYACESDLTASECKSLNILKHSMSVLDFPISYTDTCCNVLGAFNWSVIDMGLHIPLKEAIHAWCRSMRQNTLLLSIGKPMTGQPRPIYL
ncbi:hypothetical protein TNCT_393871 [Trichonephila clavata]|uniref:Uncharacterized protein n=1 Tax=Trichonephila clavata TaxID=2740835 RepID=A0A8X6K5H9_TRICU|nr:hypothetical protein TNCT_393871 [Trichonephila clavata]